MTDGWVRWTQLVYGTWIKTVFFLAVWMDNELGGIVSSVSRKECD